MTTTPVGLLRSLPIPKPDTLPTAPSGCFEENCDWSGRHDAFRDGGRSAARFICTLAKARAVLTAQTRDSAHQGRALIGAAIVELGLAIDDCDGDDAAVIAFYVDGLLENLHACIDGWSK